MHIAIVIFDGFDEIDAFVSLSLLNRLSALGWKAELAAPVTRATSMNGITVDVQRPLAFANKADAVLCHPPGVEDKNPRFVAVQQGHVDGLPALHVVMWVGDNVQDFPGLTQAQMRTMPDSAFSEFGRAWWILPNPIYGSWQNNPLPSQP